MNGTLPDPLDLSVHHVGGRSATRDFPILPIFECDIESVMYEGDEGCIGQMKERLKQLPSKNHVLPVFVGKDSGMTDFHLVKDRYCNSALLPHAIKQGFWFNTQFGFDEDPESRQIDRTIQIRRVSLEDVLEMGFKINPPDFLSLDTQLYFLTFPAS